MASSCFPYPWSRFVSTFGANYPTPGKATDICLHCSLFLGLIGFTHLLGNQHGSHNVMTTLFCFHHISVLLGPLTEILFNCKEWGKGL